MCILALSLMVLAGRGPGIELIGVARIPGDMRDKSGLSTMIATGAGEAPADRAGSFGSGIAYTGSDDIYLACDDRGYSDGASEFPCRVQTLKIHVEPGAPTPVTAEILGTTMLVTSAGTPFVGAMRAIDGSAPRDPVKSPRLDPEGIRVPGTGTFFISDEYGPWIDEFSREGKHLRRITPPEFFLSDSPSPDPAKEAPPVAHRGRQPNRGMEGLAISPDGTRLYGIMQGSLIQDCDTENGAVKPSTTVRMFEYVLSPGTPRFGRQDVYQLESPTNSVSEILAVSARMFLVLERDTGAGKAAAFRSIYLINIDDITDVSAMPSLPGSKLPSGVIGVPKKLFLDLMDPAYGLAGDSMPEKIEGMAFGPDLKDGRRTLVITSDNDMSPTSATQVWVFAFDPKLLPEFAPQRFKK